MHKFFLMDNGGGITTQLWRQPVVIGRTEYVWRDAPLGHAHELEFEENDAGHPCDNYFGLPLFGKFVDAFTK